MKTYGIQVKRRKSKPRPMKAMRGTALKWLFAATLAILLAGWGIRI